MDSIKAGQRTKQCGLAGAVRAEDGEGTSCIDHDVRIQAEVTSADPQSGPDAHAALAVR
jgi:hypothetical protein